MDVSPYVESMHRVQPASAAPQLYGALVELHAATERAAVEAGLDQRLLELVRLRCSQLNGCAFCVDLHSAAAVRTGYTHRRLFALTTWRDTPFFDDRERAALALAESVTTLAAGHVPDEVYEAAAVVFTEDELALLVWTATVINAMNRLSVTARMQPS